MHEEIRLSEAACAGLVRSSLAGSCLTDSRVVVYGASAAAKTIWEC